MNRHFDRNNDSRPEIPRRAYALVDHLERDDRRPDTVLIGIDLIDADWLDRQGDRDPALDLSLPPEKLVRLWQQRGNSIGSGGANPFAAAPLYRLEVEVSSGDSLALNMRVPDRRDPALRQATAAFERQWFTLELQAGANQESPALLYTGLFAPATPVTVKGAMPSGPKIAKALRAMFSIRHLPQLSANDFPAAEQPRL